MQPISFDTFVQNNLKKADNKNTTKHIELPKDTVEISSKNASEPKTKKSLTKKQIVLIGAAAGLAIAGIASIIKSRNLEKAKKEIAALYDSIFDEMRKTTSSQINFEKPELVFKRLEDYVGGGYIPTKNVIEVDPRDLRHACILKNLKNIKTIKLAEDLEIADTHARSNFWQIIKKGLSDKYRMATKNEALALSGSVLTHELQHAKQFQILLSTEGGLEQYVQSLQKGHPGATMETIKKNCPFVFNYKPKKLLDPDKVVIVDDVPGGNKIKYGLKSIIEAFTGYTSSEEDKLKYYTNIAEIGARAKEAIYWHKLATGELPRPEGVSDDFISRFEKTLTYNAINLAKAAAKNS